MLVATRLSVRLFQQRQSLLVSDILLIVCAIDALGLAVCDTMSYRLGAMSSVEIDESPSAANQREIALDKVCAIKSGFIRDIEEPVVNRWWEI